MSLDPALRSRIESLLQSNRVVLFMKGQPTMPQCGFSAKAVAALSALGVDYAHVNVLADQEIREGIKVYGDWPTIPQLYIDGELVGGSDIIEQMTNSGELATVLGLQAPDRTPPAITITSAAAEMLQNAVADAGPGASLALSINAQFQPNFQLAQFDANAIASESNGVRVQFDLASARRADGITIDWVDDIRGKGLLIGLKLATNNREFMQHARDQHLRLLQRRVGQRRRFLRHRGDPDLAGQVEVALVGFQFALHGGEQAGFARTVTADHATR